MTSTTTRQGDGTIIVSPTNESLQSGTIIICHGLGDTAEGFVDVAEQFSSALPHIKFILPTAPTQKVTMNMGMAMPSWYDIVGLDKRSNEYCNGIEESRAKITQLLEEEHATLGVPYDRMALAGFSQGGALSLYTGMQLPNNNNKLGGVVLMSGYLPHESGFTITPGLEDTPIFHGHGQLDPLVRLEAAIESQSVVQTKGATNYQLKTYSGLAHSVNPQELQDVLSFLKSILPPTTEFNVKLKDPAEMSIKELKAAISKAGLGRQAIGLMEKREFVELLQRHRDGKL
jgi:lysophospholipase-2